MNYTRYTFAIVLVLASTGLAALPAYADEGNDGLRGYVAIGAATLPEYEGAGSQQVIPFVAGRAQWGRRYIALEGVSARVNVLSATSWEAGPLVSIVFGRDEVVDSVAVSNLNALDDAFEVGGFVAYSWQDIAMAGDSIRLEVRAVGDVSDVYGSWQSSIVAGYAAPLGDRWTVGADISTSIVSNGYADTYFSITPGNAAASGLQVFDASGGFKDVGLGLNASFDLTKRWALSGFAGYRRLLGDAADSPIVAQEGSPDQFSAGLGIGFSF